MKMEEGETARGMTVMAGGRKREFDIDDPVLPSWVEENALTSASYPYDKRMKKRAYREELHALQVELVKLQSWLHESGERIMAVFEGRDAAGKGGTIKVLREHLNPRSARDVALTKPTETERGQWYFQRYVAHFPTSGEFVTFDRSWYNRAGVEPVMGFCTPAEHEKFLRDTPQFELSIVNDGIHFFKFWLNIGRETQLKRFHARHHSPVRHWKFSPIDLAGIEKWDDYTKMRDLMMRRTHTAHAPWIVVRANDKRRARLAVMRRILNAVPYDGKDEKALGEEDGSIIFEAPVLLAQA